MISLYFYYDYFRQILFILSHLCITANEKALNYDCFGGDSTISSI